MSVSTEWIGVAPTRGVHLQELLARVGVTVDRSQGVRLGALIPRRPELITTTVTSFPGPHRRRVGAGDSTKSLSMTAAPRTHLAWVDAYRLHPGGG